jgi:hypothetical protein
VLTQSRWEKSLSSETIHEVHYVVGNEGNVDVEAWRIVRSAGSLRRLEKAKIIMLSEIMARCIQIYSKTL